MAESAVGLNKLRMLVDGVLVEFLLTDEEARGVVDNTNMANALGIDGLEVEVPVVIRGVLELVVGRPISVEGRMAKRVRPPEEKRPRI